MSLIVADTKVLERGSEYVGVNTVYYTSDLQEPDIYDIQNIFI